MEGTGFAEGRQPGRRGPGEGTAENAVALAQGHGQRFVPALGQARPGEAEQDTAALDPIHHLALFVLLQPSGGIGQD